jgi:hypothetical protein
MGKTFTILPDPHRGANATMPTYPQGGNTNEPKMGANPRRTAHWNRGKPALENGSSESHLYFVWWVRQRGTPAEEQQIRKGFHGGHGEHRGRKNLMTDHFAMP